jgi:hypothetical protein
MPGWSGVMTNRGRTKDVGIDAQGEHIAERNRTRNAMQNKITGLLVSAVLAVGGVLAAVPAAQASVAHAWPAARAVSLSPETTGTCWDNGCYNIDPKTGSNCSTDGQVVLTKTWSGIGTIDLMWSQICGANWALIENAAVGRHFYVENNNGAIQAYNVPAGGNWGYTNMVGGYNIPAEACIYDNGYYCVQQAGFNHY